MSGSHNPLDQFKLQSIVPIEVGGYDISFTNASLFMVATVVLTLTLMLLGMRRRAMVPGRIQSLAEMTYEFIAGMLKENVGAEGKKYFPLIFSLFLFILGANLLGMLPFSFTVTSHIIVTFALAILVFVTVTAVGFLRHGFHFLSFFLPKGTPWWMLPLMILIELFAYLARPMTLSIRLAANMMAGHIILKLFAGFVIALGFLGGWLPLAFLVALTGFEFFVAVLQAYIFTLLTCVYLNDAVHMH